MPVDLKILAIDAQIVELRRDIDSADDKSSPEVAAKQNKVDKLIEERYARLVEIEKQLDASNANGNKPEPPEPT